MKNDRSRTGTSTRSRQQPVAGSVDIGLSFSSLLEVYGADVSERRVQASSLRPRAPTSGITPEQLRVPEPISRCGPPIGPPLDDGVIEPGPACVQIRILAAAIAWFVLRLLAAGQEGLGHLVAR